MVGLDQHGFELLVDTGRARLRFVAPCPTPQAVRAALVTLTAQARGTTP